MLDRGWDKLFKRVDWGKYPSEEVVRFISRNFGDNNTKQKINILEVGSGPGANIWYLSREGYSVTGIDGSKVAVGQSKKRLKTEGLYAELYVGDIVELPFKNFVFDCVLDVECLYSNNFENSNKIIAEIHRVLKPGGVFFSKTFSTSMSGKGDLIDKNNTYSSFDGGELHSDYETVRLLDEKQIPILYGIFDSIEYDLVTRTDRNRKNIVEEWLISCWKSK